MLKRAAIAAALLVATAAAAVWLLSGNGPRPLRSGLDAVVRIVTGTDPYARCWTKTREANGLVVFAFAAPDDCYRFQPQRTFSGIYIDQFEGQHFVEGAAGPPPYSTRETVWLHLGAGQRRSLNARLGPNPPRRPRFWQLTFVGRRAVGQGGFGHMGGSDGLIVVDQIRSASLVASDDGYVP